MVWDAVTGKCLFKISDVFGGPISCLTWLERSTEEYVWPNFCFGNASGYIVSCTYIEDTVSSLCHRIFDIVSFKVAVLHLLSKDQGSPIRN